MEKELWDLYDEKKNMLERKAIRGGKLNKGNFIKDLKVIKTYKKM